MPYAILKVVISQYGSSVFKICRVILMTSILLVAGTLYIRMRSESRGLPSELLLLSIIV